tara:strand:+ start:99 stop:743 length:645 start_codon:yes stop_codon:yes gene_type:complete
MTYYNNEKKKANLALWEQVSKTNPAHTKPVSFGRGFTAIDAHSQIMCATEAFGPVGIGWGYNVEYKIDDKMLIAFVSIWQQDHANSFGPICSIAPLYNKKGQLDDDAGKKAMTDALTKGLSHLGFNADVFLGKFDDNKYVTERNIEIQKEKTAKIKLPEDLQKIVDDATKIKEKNEVTKFLKKLADDEAFEKFKDSEKLKARGKIAEHIETLKK